MCAASQASMVSIHGLASRIGSTTRASAASWVAAETVFQNRPSAASRPARSASVAMRPSTITRRVRRASVSINSAGSAIAVSGLRSAWCSQFAP